MQVPTRPGRAAAADQYTAWLCVCFCTETLFSMYVAVPMIPYHGPRSQRRCNARPKFNARIFFLTHITASLCSATLDRTSALRLEAILRVINKAYECKGARRRIDREEVAVSSVMAGTGGRASRGGLPGERAHQPAHTFPALYVSKSRSVSPAPC